MLYPKNIGSECGLIDILRQLYFVKNKIRLHSIEKAISIMEVVICNSEELYKFDDNESSVVIK